MNTLDKAKIFDIVDIYGVNSVQELIDQFGDDSISPGICYNEDCDYTTEVEPDCSDGYCEDCGTNTVKSFHVILGVI